MPHLAQSTYPSSDVKSSVITSDKASAPAIRAYLGGSFDPVHNGHLQMALYVYQYLLPIAEQQQRELSARQQQRMLQDQQAQQLQQQRQQALEQQLTPPVPDIRLSPSEHSAGRIVFPAETPCFTLHSVTLTGHNDLPRWLPLQRLANQAVGHCLGTQGIIPE